MIRKALKPKTDELAEHAWYLHRYTQEDADFGEAEAVAKVTEYCDKICSMAKAIKKAVGNVVAKAVTFEKVHPVERRLNFGNEILGTQPGLSFKSFGTSLTSKLEQFPDPVIGTITSSLRLAKIECYAASSFIYSMKLTMNDGTKSSLLGNIGYKPNESVRIPSDIKIAKLRSGFVTDVECSGLYRLTQLKLFDRNGGLIWKCGDGRFTNKSYETTVPKGETVVGFKIVTNESMCLIKGLGLVTARYS